MPRLAKLLPLLLPALIFIGCQKSVSTGGGTPGSATPQCGNGQLDLGELCDPAAAGAAACPTNCDDGIACTTSTITGSACRATCQHNPIATCQGGDGCCAPGCTNSNDVDCSATCGDGVVDAFETCDGNCMACEALDACTTVTQYGSATTCNIECGYSSTAVCGAADSCCPPGCTSASDPDCSSSCGDGTIDPGETCDGNCLSECPSTSCETSMLMGSAMTCTSTCTFSLITMCADGDTCCPEGCEGQDDDCGIVTGGVGSACTANTECQAFLTDQTAVCAPNPPFTDGYCTKPCTASSDCPSGSLCDIELAICVQQCTSGGTECRSGYDCTSRLDSFEAPYNGCLPIAD